MNELWLFAVAGLSGGGAYALTALGLVAVYRGSGVLNFAQGAVGTVGAYAFWALRGQDVPIGLALLAGVLIGGLIGCAFYAGVVRFMGRTSELGKVIATLGLLLFLQSAANKHYGALPKVTGKLFDGEPIEIWGARITIDTVVILGATVIIGVLLSVIFTRTPLGLRATALYEGPAAAAAVGISPHSTGLASWGLGGCVSSVASILVLPLTGLAPSNMTLIVIPAMAAALLGSFMSVWKAIGVGIGIGVVQSLMIQKAIDQAFIRALPFAVILIALCVGGVALPGRGFQAIRLPRLGSGRVTPVKMLIGLGIVMALSVLFAATWQEAVISSSIFCLLGLSVVVVTGYAGQISLASSALAGFSSLIAAHAGASWGFPFLGALASGVAVAVAVGLIVGIPAVRVRGTNLAIATLGLGLMIEDGILAPPRFTGGTSGIKVDGATLFGFTIDPGRHPGRYAATCIVCVLLVGLAVANIRRGRSGRRYVAVRANERGAAACGISVSGAKLGAFGVSAGIAGLAGVLTTYRFQVASFSSFNVFQSISVLVFTVVGGVGQIAGAVFAGVSASGGMASYVINYKLGLHTIDSWLTIVTGLAVLDIMIRTPDGIIYQFRAMARGVRHLVSSAMHATRPGRRPKDNVATTPARVDESLDEWVEVCRTFGSDGAPTTFVAEGIVVRYGEVQAVADVSLELKGGRVTGVIGANGAGKTTLIDALTGFKKLSEGRVAMDGEDFTRLSAKSRARAGLVRTFQNLELFEDLTVRENLLTAADRRDGLAYITDLVRPLKPQLSPMATAAANALGLSGDLDSMVTDLPQGKRRMLAIARVVAQQPRVVCLDEPAAGLSGPERRLAAKLFRSLAHEYGAAVLLVEHNVDVVAESCDEVIVLNFGRVIARGRPDEVLSDPRVRDAYLGSASVVDAAEANRLAVADVGN